MSELTLLGNYILIQHIMLSVFIFFITEIICLLMYYFYKHLRYKNI